MSAPAIVGTAAIGITYSVQGSIFGSSRGQAAIFLADVFKALGAAVTLVCSGTVGGMWWDDAAGLEAGCQLVRAADASGLDLLIDVDAAMSPTLRRQAAKRAVGLLRGRVLFAEMEQSSYLQQNAGRNTEGLSAVWIWDALNEETDVGALRVLFGGLPVVRVPFVWHGGIIENYMRLAGIQWPVAAAQAAACPVEAALAAEQERPFTIRIAEKNTGSTSSAIVPLMGAVAAVRDGMTVGKVAVYNGLAMRETPFYKSNIAPSVECPVDYLGRERYVDWLEDGGQPAVVLTHTRFVPFRVGQLDLAYLGLPFVHNSVVLRDLGAGVYYEGNSVSGMVGAVRGALSAGAARGRWQGPWTVEAGRGRWQEVLTEVVSDSTAKQETLSVAAELPTAPDSSAQPAPPSPEPLTVGFTDMWEGFNPASNFFLDLIATKIPSVRGIAGWQGAGLLICGPFGNNHVGATCPKVFFSGENVPLPEADTSISLFLSSEPREGKRHARLPIWMLFLKWFGKSYENPVGLPVEAATESHPIPFAVRKHDFSFVVSNPMNEHRNEFFLALSKRAAVRSAGALFNNIGGPLHSLYGGGGGGDVAKHEFLQGHKFNICFENSAAPGYVTEKLLHAKLAGCVPIYWGDASGAAADFDPAGFLDLTGLSLTDAVAATLSLAADPDRAAAMAARPALDADRLAAAKRQLSAVAERIVGLVGSPPDSVKPTQVTIPSPLFVSYATEQYIASISHNAVALERQRQHIPKIRYRVYLGDDVAAESRASLASRFPWLELLSLPADRPAPFPDFWEPANFGWKLWILATLATDETLKDSLVVYTDAGAQWLGLPDLFLYKGYTAGACMVLCHDQINLHWCSEKMVDAMSVTEAELAANQTLAGFHAFRPCSPLAVAVYKEALAWGSKRDVLVGKGFVGLLPNGQPFGHRHDQSILSVLRLRHGVPTVMNTDFINERSLRLAALERKPVYLHRGQPVGHRKPLPSIDDVWMINLDRRPDRWASWAGEYPDLAALTHRLPAIDGKKLDLTAAVRNFFYGNDFIWKKAVTAVAMSHILLWCQLAAEKDPVDRYLILEDDVRFRDAGWTAVWERAAAAAPPDAELLYLGGILPGNRAVYEDCLDPVNDVWARIKPNPYFTTDGSLAPVFHFCAYSYVLTKAGARKLVAALASGCRTSIDHFLGGVGLRKYVMRDLMATCFQEDDPVYQRSEFDNFKRVDSFDSDIWNNVDCWTEAEVAALGPIGAPSLQGLVGEMGARQPTHQITRSVLGLMPAAANGSGAAVTVFCKSVTEAEAMPEVAWLRRLGFNFRLAGIEEMTGATADRITWILIHRPHITYWEKTCREWDAAGKSFCVIHLADEAEKDSLALYELSHCRRVFRNYCRAGLPAAAKVTVLPLGLAATPGSGDATTFTSRPLTWAFHGTDWFGRGKTLSALAPYKPNDLHLTPTWKDPAASAPAAHAAALATAKFIPILRGNNFETYRLYEALEAGSIPLYVRTEGDATYWNWLRQKLSLIELPTWETATKAIDYFLANSDKAEEYRKGLIGQWSAWKREIGEMFRK